MTLASILVVYSLTLAWSPPGVLGFGAHPAGQELAAVKTTASSQAPAIQDSTPPSQPAPPAQSPGFPKPVPAPSGQPQSPAGPSKPSPAKPHRRHKKASPSNCSTAPTALNPAVGSPADSTNAGSNDAGSAPAGSSNTGAAAAKPCPPPKKVVRNGGSSEPTVQLKGGTAEEASHERSTTDQLTTATQENLKKIEGGQLNPSQQEMVNQIKQFMEQSKAAVATGDLERGRNLAMKAHLLSDELAKP